MSRVGLYLALLLAVSVALAGTPADVLSLGDFRPGHFPVCSGYGCDRVHTVSLTEAEWQWAISPLAGTDDAGAERANTVDSALQLQPYRSGMSLLAVFETFPGPGLGKAELRLLIVAAAWSFEFAEMLTENPRARLAADAPKTYRYRIVHNEDGTPKRDGDGEPIVEFGPEDHTDVESMVRLKTYRKILEAADTLPGVSPFF